VHERSPPVGVPDASGEQVRGTVLLGGHDDHLPVLLADELVAHDVLAAAGDAAQHVHQAVMLDRHPGQLVRKVGLREPASRAFAYDDAV